MIFTLWSVDADCLSVFRLSEPWRNKVSKYSRDVQKTKRMVEIKV